MDKEFVKLTVRVQPNARENIIAGLKEGVLQIRITAPPVEGKANEAVIKFLSKQLDLRKSQLTIEHGLTGRNKTILISGLSRAELEKRLGEFAGNID